MLIKAIFLFIAVNNRLIFFWNRHIKSEISIVCVLLSVVYGNWLLTLSTICSVSQQDLWHQTIKKMLKPHIQLRCEVFFCQQLSHNHQHLQTGALNAVIMANICWLNCVCCNSRGLKWNAEMLPIKMLSNTCWRICSCNLQHFSSLLIFVCIGLYDKLYRCV